MYPSYIGYFYFLVSILIRLTRFMHLHLFEVNYPKEVWKIFIWLVEYFLLSSFLFWSRLTRWDFPRNPCNHFFFYNVKIPTYLKKKGMNQLLMMTEQLLRLTTYIPLSAGESAWKGDKFEDWKYGIPFHWIKRLLINEKRERIYRCTLNWLPRGAQEVPNLGT